MRRYNEDHFRPIKPGHFHSLLSRVHAFSAIDATPTIAPTPLHSGAASGHRTFWAMVEIIEAVLESLRPLLSDLRTVVLLNFKKV